MSLNVIRLGTWAAVLLVASVSAFQYNATIERLIELQKQRWCSGVFHSVPFRNEDNSYFEDMCARNYSSYEYAGNLHRRYKRQGTMARTEYRCMTTAQRSGYHWALKQMKNTMAGGLSQYDNFVTRHDGRVARPAHFGPSFGPWHREYLMTLERAMRVYCPACMVPYWDSRLDKRIGGNPAMSAMFGPTTFGNANGPVVTGFAANWKSASPECKSIGLSLRRNMNPSASSFYDDNDVSFTDFVSSHQSISYPWATRLEFSHGYLHNAFGPGSHMSDIMCSPSDPIFISHHAFVDYLFERSRRSMRRQGGLVYPNTNAANHPNGFDDSDDHIKVACAGTSPMSPFPNLINSFGLLSDVYTTVYYRYERTPGDVTCTLDTECCGNGNTEFLFCDTNRKICVSKVQENGQINPSYPPRACHCTGGRTPSIQGGYCRCTAVG